ncbi:SAGA-associated factor 29 homolog A-like [Cryptomeria japonica]|uniref:SAGA-associated factor 29 homolog A-like n=1 Tax=Cryptomeria japonica TaxID=3369 RepID=UPI0025AC53E5|nr:SAGA-associated factor 29 homolog A-like [Cryptomeria japonica]
MEGKGLIKGKKVTMKRNGLIKGKKDTKDVTKVSVPTRKTLNSLPVSTILRVRREHPNVVIGDQVAGSTSDNADKQELMLVEVTRSDKEANKYEVTEEEPGDDREDGPRVKIEGKKDTKDVKKAVTVRTRIRPPRVPGELRKSTILRLRHEHPDVVIGDQVAGRVTSDNADKQEWMVVKVTRFDKEANKYVECFFWYEVTDGEPGDDKEDGPGYYCYRNHICISCFQYINIFQLFYLKYKLPPSCVISFPKRTVSSKTACFPTGSQVLAVYPGTASLYTATIVGSHRKRTSINYLLEFDDDEEDGVDGLPERTVPFFHVVQLPDGHCQ